MIAINLNDIKVVNWNANGIKSKKKSTLIHFLTRHKIDMLALQKHNLKIINLLKLPVSTSTKMTEMPFTHLEE